MQQKLTRAARRAINELNLPCEVVDVVHVSGGDGWAIEFTSGYDQLIASFRDDRGQEYSDEQIIETIKQHLSLKEALRVRPSDR